MAHQIERNLIERALSLDFLGEARNLVLMGGNGLGKNDDCPEPLPSSGARWATPWSFAPLPPCWKICKRQTPEGRRRKIRAYSNVGLLCLDEVGYLSFDDKAADLFYEVINRRYQRKPLIVTTNKPFQQWNEVFPNATCLVTLLDRLIHHADVTVLEGKSYRLRESEIEMAARRKRK